MNEPTKEQLAKLPKWAQDYINQLECQRDVAVRTLAEFNDTQTPTRFCYEETYFAPGQVGPSTARRYIQTRYVRVLFKDRWIQLGFDNNGWLQLTADRGIFFVPDAHNSLRIMAEESVTYARGGEPDMDLYARNRGGSHA